MGAGVVRQAHFVALGAVLELRQGEVIVGAPHPLLGNGFFSFR